MNVQKLDYLNRKFGLLPVTVMQTEPKPAAEEPVEHQRVQEKKQKAERTGGKI